MIIRNCKFVSALTEGTELSEGDVLLESGRIARIAPSGTDFKTEDEELDLAGKYLMPGLIDMHIHLFMANADIALSTKAEDADQTINCLKFARTLLDLGYTTVRDCGDGHAWATVALSKAFASGALTGPTVIPCGPILCPTAANTTNFLLDNIDGTDDTRRKTRLAIRKGAKFIKMYGSASLNSLLGEPGLPIVEPDEIQEAVKIAKRYGMYVAIHCHGTEAIDNAVKSGVHTVEHASLISEETLQYIDAHYEEVGLVPTLSVIYNTARPERTDAVAERARKIFETVCGCLKNAYRHGVQIGWGTDITRQTYLDHPEWEFWLRKEKLEYKDEDIIRQATINSAKLLGMEEQIGTVKEGKLADLIVVEKDPSKDISAMYQKPLHVVKGGKLIR